MHVDVHPDEPLIRRRAARHRANLLARGLVSLLALMVLVAVVPWGLVRFVGWPLPHHRPGWSEVCDSLLTPMTSHVFLDILACVLWTVWGLFVVDASRAGVGVLRSSARRAVPLPHPRGGPVQTAAAVLVTSILLALLPRIGAGGAETAQASGTFAVRLADESTPTTSVQTPQASPTATVRAPRAGVYDSLWRIADRCLGDGQRWPEIYALNRGRLQPDGHALTNPDLIRPGWILALPAPPVDSFPRHLRPHPNPHPRPGTAGAAPHSAAPTTSPTPAATNPVSPTATPTAGSTDSGSSAPTQHGAGEGPDGSGSDGQGQHGGRGGGVELPNGGFVGFALAAAVAAALAVVRLRRRALYRPGSEERDYLTMAPVIRVLRVAHDRAPDSPGFVGGPAIPPAPVSGGAGETRVVGVKDGRAVAWKLARTRGLGLVGPGAEDAVRALLVDLLAGAGDPVRVLITEADAERLLGIGSSEGVALPTVRDLDTALDEMEAELLARVRATAEAIDIDDVGTRSTPGPPTAGGSPLVLVASPSEYASRRLQAVLDNGSVLGMAGVFLGQWRAGGTARVRADGTVAAVSSDIDELAGARLFALDAADARALLDLLSEAAGERPRPSSPPVHTSAGLEGLGRDEPGPGMEPFAAATARHETPPPRASGDREETSDPPGDSRARAEPTIATVEASPVSTSPRPLRLNVLGRVHLLDTRAGADAIADLTAAIAPKQREVLVFLALFQHGARRETLTTAIWPEAPSDRPYNSFHATLSQFRRALRAATHDRLTDTVLHADGHYSLDAQQISTDLWDLQEALRAARHGDEIHRILVERALDLYAGDLAVEVTAEWLEAPRESLRRDVLDAVSALVRQLGPTDPERALTLLERARTLDPYNEAVYRAIARLQAHLGRHDAVPRTLALLTTVLAEIDEQPSPETRAALDELAKVRSSTTSD